MFRGAKEEHHRLAQIVVAAGGKPVRGHAIVASQATSTGWLGDQAIKKPCWLSWIILQMILVCNYCALAFYNQRQNLEPVQVEELECSKGWTGVSVIHFHHSLDTTA